MPPVGVRTPLPPKPGKAVTGPGGGKAFIPSYQSRKPDDEMASNGTAKMIKWTSKAYRSVRLQLNNQAHDRPLHPSPSARSAPIPC